MASTARRWCAAPPWPMPEPGRQFGSASRLGGQAVRADDRVVALSSGRWLWSVLVGGSVASRTSAASSTRSLCSFLTFPISPFLNWSPASVEETGVCWSKAGHLCCCLFASAPSSCCDLAVHLNVSAEKGAFVGLTGLAAGGLTVFMRPEAFGRLTWIGCKRSALGRHGRRIRHVFYAFRHGGLRRNWHLEDEDEHSASRQESLDPPPPCKKKGS